VKPVNFDYARPGEVGAALKLIANESVTVKIMAGSQSLGPMLNMRLVQPDLLVDITGIEELRQFDERPDEIIFARGIAYRAVRNRGTIGGSLTHADPSADWHSIMAALGAKVVVRGPAGERTMAVESYMLGALEADLGPGEMLVSVKVPKLSRSARWGYYKSCRKTGEFAHAIGCFLADPDRGVIRVVIGATESRPIVIAEAGNIIGDGRAECLDAVFDSRAVSEVVEAAGMTDSIDKQTHIIALRRALEQARSA
jgi:aerobic carbon-monoxide dehydrogenase medium subunit